MDLDREIHRLQHLTQKITKIIKNGKRIDSTKSISLIDECKNIRKRLEKVVSQFVDSNDYSNFDRVIGILHASGDVLTQVDRKLGIIENHSFQDVEEDDDEEGFSKIQFSNAIPDDEEDDDESSTPSYDRRAANVNSYIPKGSSSASSFADNREDYVKERFPEEITFQADFSNLNIEYKRPEKQKMRSEEKIEKNDINALKKSLKEALQLVNDYKTYCNTLEDLIRDFALGKFQLTSHDKSTFLELNKDSTTFISNLSSALGISIMRPPAATQMDVIHYQSENEVFAPSQLVPVHYLRRMQSKTKIPFIEPVSLSNYFGRFLCNSSKELLRFGNIFSLFLSGEFVNDHYSLNLTIMCLTQSVDVFMAFQQTSSVKSAPVMQYLTKNGTAEIRGTLDITDDQFPQLSLSIVQSDGFAVKFLISLPLGAFLVLSSNFLTNNEYASVWESSVYKNSKLSFSDLSLLKYESGCTLPNPIVIFEDIKNTLTLNGRINVTSVNVQSQNAIFHLTSTLDQSFWSLYDIEAKKMKDSLNTCLIGKVYVKLISNTVNIKLELKSIVHCILISTRDCLKEALSAVLSERSPPTVSNQFHITGSDISLPLPFEPLVNEDIDFN